MSIYEFKPEDAWRFARERNIEAKPRGDELQFITCPYCDGGRRGDRRVGFKPPVLTSMPAFLTYGPATIRDPRRPVATELDAAHHREFLCRDATQAVVYGERGERAPVLRHADEGGLAPGQPRRVLQDRSEI